MQINKILRLAEKPARPIHRRWPRYIGPYGCAVPVHETLGISLKSIIGDGRDTSGPTDGRMSLSKGMIALRMMGERT
jgi:hypothetical protein